MPLEAAVFVVDNGEHSRNGDYCAGASSNSSAFHGPGNAFGISRYVPTSFFDPC